MLGEVIRSNERAGAVVIILPMLFLVFRASGNDGDLESGVFDGRRARCPG